LGIALFIMRCLGKERRRKGCSSAKKVTVSEELLPRRKSKKGRLLKESLKGEAVGHVQNIKGISPGRGKPARGNRGQYGNGWTEGSFQKEKKAKGNEGDEKGQRLAEGKNREIQAIARSISPGVSLVGFRRIKKRIERRRKSENSTAGRMQNSSMQKAG